MAETIVLVHSPLVGADSWEPVAAVLRDRGHAVAVPDLSASLEGDLPYRRHQVEAVAAQARGASVALVGHSGAGSLLPAAGAGMSSVAAYVFVDAGLPAAGRSWLAEMPPELADELSAMALDGWLPPWSEWWGPDGLAELLPDPGTRARFAAGCPALPMAMFEEAQPEVPGWPDAPCGYLRLSEAYDESAAHARALGWPVERLDSHHLGLLTHPELVAGALLEILARSICCHHGDQSTKRREKPARGGP